MTEFTVSFHLSICFGNSYYPLNIITTDDEKQAKGLVFLWYLLSVSSIFRKFDLVSLLLGESKVSQCKKNSLEFHSWRA